MFLLVAITSNDTSTTQMQNIFKDKKNKKNKRTTVVKKYYCKPRRKSEAGKEKQVK